MPLVSAARGGGAWDTEEAEDDWDKWDVVYKAPCGLSLRNYDDVMCYLLCTESYDILQVGYTNFKNTFIVFTPPSPKHLPPDTGRLLHLQPSGSAGPSPGARPAPTGAGSEPGGGANTRGTVCRDRRLPPHRLPLQEGPLAARLLLEPRADTLPRLLRLHRWLQEPRALRLRRHDYRAPWLQPPAPTGARTVRVRASASKDHFNQNKTARHRKIITMTTRCYMLQALVS